MSVYSSINDIIYNAQDLCVHFRDLEDRIAELEAENDLLSNELADAQYQLAELEGLHG